MCSTVADPDDADPLRHPAAAPPHEAVTVEHPVEQQVDVAAFTRFYRESVPRLVAFLRWQGAPLPDALDCVQETMIAAFQKWSTIRHPHAWCRLVASRRYVRIVATPREDLVADVESAAAPGAALRGADTDLDALEQRHAVLRVLDRLPPRQRQVMAWTYDGATPTEIAGALQITPEAVRANLYKARAALRDHLDTTGGELR